MASDEWLVTGDDEDDDEFGTNGTHADVWMCWVYGAGPTCLGVDH